MIDRDAVIALAKEAGRWAGHEFHMRWLSGEGCSFQDIRDERFAQAVAQKAAEAEREACAAVAKSISDKYAYGYYGQEVDTADEIEAAIRARSTGGKT